MAILTFGKYNGVDLKDVPGDYLDWLISMREKDLAEYRGELERREMVESASISMVERLVQAGYRELSKKLHPDTGGTAGEFRELKAAHEQLKFVLGEIKDVQGSGTKSN